MAQITFKPSVVRIILIVSIGLAVVANLAAFFLGKDIVTNSSQSLTEIAGEVKKNQNEIDKIESIKNQMNQIKDIPDLVAQTTTDKKDNRHQEKIIQTFQNYAKKSNLTIRTIAFASNASTTADKSTITANITFSEPNNYINIISFLKLTELGLPRMQVTDVSLSKTGTEKGDLDNVSTGTIQVQIYAK